jgi:hypothetical protein
MAFTGTEIAADARRELNDEDAGNYRYDDPDLLAHINEFIRLIWNKAPASRFDDNGDLLTFAEIAALANTVVFVHDKYQSYIMDGVMVRCFEAEGKDDQDLDRAKHHATRFTAHTGIPLIVRGG